MSNDDQTWEGDAPGGAADGHETSDLIAMLVAKCLEVRDATGGDFQVAEVCRDYPELVDEVRSSLEIASALPALQSLGTASDPMLETKLAGRYRVDSRIGSGAMGIVYSATDLDLGRRVAVKVLHRRFLDADEAMTRFDREAEALAAISHDSVVTIYDRGMTESGAPFLVMEFVDGLPCSEILSLARKHETGDSTDWLKEECGIDGGSETSLVRLMVRWTASLASGLGAAHGVGVYHRDVKPSNIMIRRDGRVVLLDFGIASLETDETMTRAESALGTPAYMAPEALLVGKVRERSTQDVYGVAATLYHMLTLKAPYQGTAQEVLAALAVREPEPATSVRPGLPRDAQAILDHGLARAPGHRYQSLAAMEKDLRALLAFQPVSVSPTGTVTRAFRRLRRSKVAIGAILATLVIASAFAVQSGRARLAAMREAAFHRALARVPANLGVVGPANRVIADGELRRDVTDVLDELVDSGHATTTATMLRASFRLDHGDVAGAAADMGLAAAATGTAYTAELARRYEALPFASHSALDLDLTALPELATPLDSYVAAYHAMRTNRYRDAIPLLKLSALDSVRHAKEMELLLYVLDFGQLNTADDLSRIIAVADRLYTGAVRIEEAFGYVSAQSAQLRGFAASKQNRYSEALNCFEEGLELTQSSHVLWLNAAECARAQSELDRARGYLGEAFRIAPTYLKLRKVLWSLEWQDRNYDKAREIIQEADFTEMRSPESSQQFELAHVYTMEAIDELIADPARSKAAAESALELLVLLPESKQPQKGELIRHAKACLTGDRDQLVSSFTAYMAGDPMSSAHLRILRTILPDELSATVTAGVARWMSALELRILLPGRISDVR